MYQKWQSCDAWFLRYEAWQTELFVILDRFLPFYCPNNLKIKILKNWKKTPGDIILHKHTTNHDHMLYCSLDMAGNGLNCYFSFWAIFCRVTSLTTQKMKIFKKWKICLEISSFYNSAPKIMIIHYTVPKIWCMTDVIFFILGHFLLFYPPNSLKNQNLKKMYKTDRDIIILHKCTKNHDYILCCSYMTHDRYNYYFSIPAIFCPFTC